MCAFVWMCAFARVLGDLDIVPNALTNTHTSCLLRANKEEGRERSREKVCGRGKEVSLPDGNEAKIKTKDKTACMYQTSCSESVTA